MPTEPTDQTTIATRPPSRIATFRGTLTKMRDQLAVALPKHLDVDRMLRVVFTTVQRTPQLLDCTETSLLGCIVQCAQLGLEPDGLLGHAYLIPFKNRKENRTECQLVIGYKGLLKLARQSGEIASVSARIVHAKDFFEYEYGLKEKLRHVPYVVKEEKDDAGAAVFAYAIFRFKDGSYHFDVMGFQEIEWIRKASPSGNSPAWTDHWDEMAKKTVLRRASKMSPASIEDRMARAIALDEQHDANIPQKIDHLGSNDFDAIEEATRPALTSMPEGKREPLRRPEQKQEVAAQPAATKTTAAKPAGEDPDAAARAAAAPTAEEIAKMDQGRTPGSDDEEVPPWVK